MSLNGSSWTVDLVCLINLYPFSRHRCWFAVNYSAVKEIKERKRRGGGRGRMSHEKRQKFKETTLNWLREESMQKKERNSLLPRPVDAVTSTALPNEFSKHLYFVLLFLFYFLSLSLPSSIFRFASIANPFHKGICRHTYPKHLPYLVIATHPAYQLINI